MRHKDRMDSSRSSPAKLLRPEGPGTEAGSKQLAVRRMKRMFGKSFEEKVNQAVEKVRGSFPGATISATVADKVVTLQGEADDVGMKGRIAEEFNKHVETD